LARKTNFELMVQALAFLPWWTNLAAAVAAFFIFNSIAGQPVEPSTPGQLDMASHIFRGFATVLRFAVPLLFVLAAVVSFFQRAKRRTLLDQQTGLESIRAFSWRQFETLVGEIYRRRGFAVIETPDGPDGGVDLVARKDGEKHLIQCKHWKAQKVSVQVVRELLGVLYRTGAAGGIIVTTGEFTQAARREAAGQALELVNGSDLLKLLPGIDLPVETPPATDPAPDCPRCGALMLERQNRKTGESFWGCSTFPSCKATKSRN
jgi:restriction system protein